MKQPREQNTQRAILDYLKLRGIFAWKNSNVGIFNKKTGAYIPSHTRGVSDILGVLPGGRSLAIEVKRKGNKPTKEQQAFIDNVNECGGLAFVAYSLDDVERELPKSAD